MRKKQAIVISIPIIIILFLVRAYFSGSTETSTTPNPQSETSAIAFDESSLLDRGVTSGQLSSLEQVLGQYLSSQDTAPNQVDFNTIRRAPPDPKRSTPFTEITFEIQVDGEPYYKAKMDAFGSSEIRLYLYDLYGGTLLYDSQNVGGSSSL